MLLGEVNKINLKRVQAMKQHSEQVKKNQSMQNSSSRRSEATRVSTENASLMFSSPQRTQGKKLQIRPKTGTRSSRKALAASVKANRNRVNLFTRDDLTGRESAHYVNIRKAENKLEEPMYIDQDADLIDQLCQQSDSMRYAEI